MINEIKDLGKLFTKEPPFTALHTHKLEYTQIKWDIDKQYINTMNAFIDHKKLELVKY